MTDATDLRSQFDLGVDHPDHDGCDVAHITASLPAADVSTSMLLADHTTLRVGGPAERLVVATTEQELIDVVEQIDAAGEPLLLLGGGSNVLVSDDGFEGTVVKVATRGLDADVSGCGGAYVRVAAGEHWDSFVAHAIAQEWRGIETLSGIPGLVGASPIQNVGAYGAEVAQTIARVRTYDRHDQQVRSFTASTCGFAYRDSRFKRELGRYVVLTVDYQFELGQLSGPIRYAELARTLGVEVGQRAPMLQVREAVLSLRRGKGMVLDAADHDTWSAGSFFTNPILDADAAASLPEGAPRFVQPDGTVKSSAAWLIQHAGFDKGFGSGPATLSTKHTLALTNRGSATAADIAGLAREIRSGVEARFGVTLVPEPTFIGVDF